GLVGDGDLGVDGVERSDDVIQLGLGAAPGADGVGPQGDGHVAAGRAGSGGAGSRGGSGGGSGGAAGAGAAAGSQRAGCAHSARDLQEVPARDEMFHNVLLLSCLVKNRTARANHPVLLFIILQRNEKEVNTFWSFF